MAGLGLEPARRRAGRRRKRAATRRRSLSFARRRRQPPCSARRTAWPSARCARSASAACAPDSTRRWSDTTTCLLRFRGAAAVDDGDRRPRHRAGELADLVIARIGGADVRELQTLLPVRQVPRATAGAAALNPSLSAYRNPGRRGRRQGTDGRRPMKPHPPFRAALAAALSSEASPPRRRRTRSSIRRSFGRSRRRPRSATCS